MCIKSEKNFSKFQFLKILFDRELDMLKKLYFKLFEILPYDLRNLQVMILYVMLQIKELIKMNFLVK